MCRWKDKVGKDHVVDRKGVRIGLKLLRVVHRERVGTEMVCKITLLKKSKMTVNELIVIIEESKKRVDIDGSDC